MGVFNCDGHCPAAEVLRETVAELRAALKDREQAMLAVIDAKAYALRVAADKGAPAPKKGDTVLPASSPQELRGRRWEPTLTSAEVEASFAAEAADKQAQAGASGNPERES